MKLWLAKNDMEMFSTHNEGKSVVAESFIRTLKNQIHDFSFKNGHIDKLDDVVSKYNNSYHNTIVLLDLSVRVSLQ